MQILSGQLDYSCDQAGVLIMRIMITPVTKPPLWGLAADKGSK